MVAGLGIARRLRPARRAYQIPSTAEGSRSKGFGITSREVCEALGMSETPVREALRSLAAEGWLDMHPHLGVVVAGVDPWNVIELYRIGGMLGALAIERAAAAHDAAYLDRREAAAAADLARQHERNAGEAMLAAIRRKGQ
jgi:DNA-binding GntR family transcriptional regulator